ncbi:MAG: signal peptide peptidase SppA [Proteobacteria bacterium]|nr:signal peptide peptidase SppA [Pseudomonadota bacterium]
MRKFFGRLFAVIGGLVFFAVLGSLASLFLLGKKEQTLPEKAVLTLEVSGNIPETRGHVPFPFNLVHQSLSLYDITSTLEHAASDPSVKGIVVKLGPNSLGLAQVQDLRQAVARFRAKGKFALIHTDTFGEMTGGTLPYYLASAFDEIALQNMGNVAFVGLSMELPFARRLLDEWQVVPRFAQREEFKGIMETFTLERMSESSRTELTGLLKDIMAQIIQDVAKDRELNEDEVTHISQSAPFYHAEEARRRGLLDQVTYYDLFETYARKKAGPGGELFPFAAYASHARRKGKEKSKDRPIALVFASGQIARSATISPVSLMPTEAISSDDLTDIFDELLDPKKPKPAAVVLRIDSPGGAPIPSETIWRLLTRTREMKIPVVVSMGNMAASGGYWIATAADKIVAQGTTITGSIGVAGGKIVLDQLWRRFGVEWGHVATSPNANALSPNEDFTPEQWQAFNESIDYTYTYFLHRVSKGRNLSAEKTHEVAKGRVWTGRQALELGLVDQLGDLHSAIALAHDLAGLDKSTPPATVIYPKNQGLGGIFSGAFGPLLDHEGAQALLKCFVAQAVSTTAYPTYRPH